MPRQRAALSSALSEDPSLLAFAFSLYKQPIGIARLDVAAERPEIDHFLHFVGIAVDDLALGIAHHIDLFADEADRDAGLRAAQLGGRDVRGFEADQRRFALFLAFGTAADGGLEA